MCLFPNDYDLWCKESQVKYFVNHYGAECAGPSGQRRSAAVERRRYADPPAVARVALRTVALVTRASATTKVPKILFGI